MKQDVHFANVDLEIKSNENLQLLVNALGNNVDVLYHDQLEDGVYFASLEVRMDKVDLDNRQDANEIIKVFCALIKNLSSQSRKLWDNCLERKFDIGFESGNTEKAFNTNISFENLNSVVEIGATITITIYPFRDK